MGSATAIQWTHHTFNPWWGCTKISEGCTNCYAEAWDKRTGGTHWGKTSWRRFFGAKHWQEPVKWNAAAKAAGERRRVFCASMADVFEDPPGETGSAVGRERERLWALIRETLFLDWQLLTKRPGNIWSMLPSDWGNGYANVWLGTSAEDQGRWDERVPLLLSVPGFRVLRFVSAEPLLGQIDPMFDIHRGWRDSPSPQVEWLIVGSESGPHARPMLEEWVRRLRDECLEHGVAFFLKQYTDEHGKKVGLPILDGRRWAEFPEAIP